MSGRTSPAVTESDTGSELTGEVGVVLVVDDERDVAETTALMLEQRDLDATWEVGTEDALERLRESGGEIACVVSDYQMPRMDGLEFLAAVREIDSSLPFILFTGQGSERIASEAIEAGVSGYIQKGGMEQYDRVANRARRAIANRQTRRELEETRARFEALTQNTSFAIVTIDEHSTVQYASDAVEDVLGFPPDELEGESLTAIIPDRLVEAHREGLRRYLQTGEKRLDWGWVELTACRRDGSEVPVGVSFGERADGDRHLFTGIIRDISDRKARLEELERERERFETVFESALDAMFVIDPDSETIRAANPAACEMLGHDREELRGTKVEEIHPDDYAEVLAFAQEVLERGGGRLEMVCHTATGEPIPAEVAGSVLSRGDERQLLAVVRPKNAARQLRDDEQERE